MARCRVLLCQHLDQTMSVHYGPHLLGRYDAAGQILQLVHEHKPKPPSADRRRIMKADAIGDRHREERKKDQKRKKGAA